MEKEGSQLSLICKRNLLAGVQYHVPYTALAGMTSGCKCVCVELAGIYANNWVVQRNVRVSPSCISLLCVCVCVWFLGTTLCVCVCVCVCERERVRVRERERERERERREERGERERREREERERGRVE